MGCLLLIIVIAFHSPSLGTQIDTIVYVNFMAKKCLTMFNHTVQSTFLCSASATQYLNPRSVIHWSLINKIWLFFTFLHDWISISCFPLFLKVHFIRFSSHFPGAHIYSWIRFKKSFICLSLFSVKKHFYTYYFELSSNFSHFQSQRKN